MHDIPDHDIPNAALQWVTQNGALIQWIYQRYGYGWGVPPDDWEQEAFLAVMEGMKSYNPDHPTGARPSTYLYCCLRNKIIAMRSKLCKPVYGASGQKWFDDGSHGGRWDESSVATRIDLQRCIKQLPDYLQTTLLLYLQGYRCDDIASKTGVQVGTVRKRLQRLRSVLRKLMADANP
jgi:RNA polymerase sigma factor (sigma-70 family)